MEGGPGVDHRRLDEALDILERAWTGEPFSYTGTHHAVENLVFRPTPVQQPRIPVRVVGRWPAPRSMNRTIAWDGVMPQVRGRSPEEPLSPADVAEVAAWVSEHRTATTPFDVIVAGVLPDGPTAAAAHARAMADAGATWWVESRWDIERDTPEVLLDRIKQGPPGA
ncbi:MAG: LLM class flavin-dependent oxidoreductase [Actinomycetales bacterium]|nr:LLM class flavin-dependent oxidoreductase [Actinomycetales bacterium]